MLGFTAQPTRLQDFDSDSDYDFDEVEKTVRNSTICKETVMAQIIHCFMLLFIVLVIAEIRNVLTSSDPLAQPLIIWDEVQPPVGGLGYNLTSRR